MGVVRPESVNWPTNHQNTQETAKSELVFRMMLREPAVPVDFFVELFRSLLIPETALYHNNHNDVTKDS